MEVEIVRLGSSSWVGEEHWNQPRLARGNKVNFEKTGKVKILTSGFEPELSEGRFSREHQKSPWLHSGLAEMRTGRDQLLKTQRNLTCNCLPFKNLG